jgi:cell division protein FtsB
MANVGWVISVCTFMLLHLGGAIWFFSALKTRVDALVKAFERMERVLEQTGAQDSRIAVLDSRVNGLEHRLEETRMMVLGPRRAE